MHEYIHALDDSTAYFVRAVIYRNKMIYNICARFQFHKHFVMVT
jgi:hypothetical protein